MDSLQLQQCRRLASLSSATSSSNSSLYSATAPPPPSVGAWPPGHATRAANLHFIRSRSGAPQQGALGRHSVKLVQDGPRAARARAPLSRGRLGAISVFCIMQISAKLATHHVIFVMTGQGLERPDKGKGVARPRKRQRQAPKYVLRVPARLPTTAAGSTSSVGPPPTPTIQPPTPAVDPTPTPAVDPTPTPALISSLSATLLMPFVFFDRVELPSDQPPCRTFRSVQGVVGDTNRHRNHCRPRRRFLPPYLFSAALFKVMKETPPIPETLSPRG
ncbi:hypothetical protein LR48_Vigan846s001100 [Vigna angularis]|uniref:Uncharacterized protein n=1 Tax=Phaseolus angularis TaxID=3914 RepID=A0A0L9TI01_PHAAN|nr:hypothetical protein LR48_Vigan846s001100 [Vigna angularis]